MFLYVAMYVAVDCTVKICDVPNVSRVTHDKSMRDHVSFFEETKRIHQMVWYRPPFGALKLKSFDLAPRAIFEEQAVLLRGAEFLLPEQIVAPEQDRSVR